jgi:PAS domain S-box-containing protein
MPGWSGAVELLRRFTDRGIKEEVFRLAADAVNGVVFEWDLGHAIVHRSRAVREVLGLEPEEIAAQGLWSARVHPMDQAAYEETISQSLRSAMRDITERRQVGHLAQSAAGHGGPGDL